MRGPDSKQNPWRAAGLAGAIGADIALCTVLGYFAGKFMANTFGGASGWIVGGVMTGFFAGIASVVFLLKKFLEDDDG